MVTVLSWLHVLAHLSTMHYSYNLAGQDPGSYSGRPKKYIPNYIHVYLMLLHVYTTSTNLQMFVCCLASG